MVLTNRRIMQLKAPGFADIQRAAEMGQSPTSMADLPAAKVSWAVSWQVGIFQHMPGSVFRSKTRQPACGLALQTQLLPSSLQCVLVLTVCLWAPARYWRHKTIAFTNLGPPRRQGTALHAFHLGLLRSMVCTMWQTALQP